MSSFVNLPSDVHLAIWRFLSLSDLITLQQVSKGIADRVTEDKTLWITIFKEEVLRRRLPVPADQSPLYCVTALDVQSWVKHAFLLQRNYRNGLVKSVRTQTYQGITWSKIIRGRWCLVASANLKEAKLAIWDLSLVNFLHPCVVVPMPGPITDGIIDDTKEYIHAAVTVATSSPFVLVLNITKVAEQVCIEISKKIPGGSHVRLLKEDYVGYAVQDGVDERPMIVNWKTGQIIPLCFPIADKSTVQPESITEECPLASRRIIPESCRAMGIWKNYLIVILLTRMHIFRIASESDCGQGRPDLGNVTWLTCLALPYFTHEAFFSDVTGTTEEENLNLGSPCLQIILREGDYLLPIVLYCIAKKESDDVLFAIYDVPGTVCPKRKKEIAARFTIGSNMRTVIWGGYARRTHARASASMYLATLSLDPRYAYMLEEEQDSFGPANEPQIMTPKGGFPLPHMISSSDFDDGRGIAVLCTITGELCVLDFAEQGILSPGSIQDDLPCSNGNPESHLAETSAQVNLDLPVDYYLRDKSRQLNGVTTPEIAVVANQLWMKPFPVRRDIPGWSNDWASFKGVCHWLPSWPRWGSHDLLYDPATVPSVRVRFRLDILGDMIPVLYDEQNQGRIIFRTGERMYVTKYEGDTEDDWDFDEFQTPDILGILPFTYSDFMALDVAHIVSVINSRDVQISLAEWFGSDTQVVAQYQLSLNAFCIRSYIRKKDGIVIDLRSMESWSEKEWDNRSQKSKRANWEGFFDDVFNESNRLSWL